MSRKLQPGVVNAVKTARVAKVRFGASEYRGSSFGVLLRELWIELSFISDK